jgi:hypothetical protein
MFGFPLRQLIEQPRQRPFPEQVGAEQPASPNGAQNLHVRRRSALPGMISTTFKYLSDGSLQWTLVS